MTTVNINGDALLETIEKLAQLQEMEAKLLEIINSGDAPSIGELNPDNLVDSYYLKLVKVIDKR